MFRVYSQIGFTALLALSSTVAPSFAKERVVLDQLEASVNSSMILLSDVAKFREVVRLRAQLDPLFAGTSVAAQGASASTSEIVDFLINERLITQQFPKNDSDVEQEINTIQNNNHLDRNTLKMALAKEGYKFPDYFELIRSTGSKRDLIDRDIRTKVSISDDDVKNYYYNHFARNNTVAQAYHIGIISISEGSFKAPSKSAAQTLANKAAQSALHSIRSGETFEEVARRVSDDSSASAGGDLGVVQEEQISPLIRDQVKKLKTGEVSSVFGSGGHYYILKLYSAQSNDNDRLEKMKEEIRGQMAAKEYQHQISLWLERQRQSAFIHRVGEQSIKEIPVMK